jgi:predicted methyltransferase
MTCTQALLSLFLFSPCNDGGGPSIDLAIAEALASPARLESDRARDALRRPDQVLAFFGIGPGMKVLDLFSGGGYYTEIVSRVVGPEGQVVAHNNAAYLAFAAEELASRYADQRLGNVERLTAEAADLKLPEASFDAALAILTWHDFYYVDADNGWPPIDEPSLTGRLCAALKPGAVLGVIDHVAVAGADVRESSQNLHRIDPERIKADLADSCFEFEGEINVLRNPADDYGKPMFDPAVRGRTDRVVYRFRRKSLDS